MAGGIIAESAFLTAFGAADKDAAPRHGRSERLDTLDSRFTIHEACETISRVFYLSSVRLKDVFSAAFIIRAHAL